MKVILEIPGPIFREAKTRAAESGIPLRQFMIQAVSDKLARPPSSQNKPWMRGFGALRHLHKETLRIQRSIDREFERIEPDRQG